MADKNVYAFLFSVWHFDTVQINAFQNCFFSSVHKKYNNFLKWWDSLLKQRAPLHSNFEFFESKSDQQFFCNVAHVTCL